MGGPRPILYAVKKRSLKDPAFTGILVFFAHAFIAGEGDENFRTAPKRHLAEDVEQLDRVPRPAAFFRSHSPEEELELRDADAVAAQDPQHLD